MEALLAKRQISGNYFDARPLFVEHRSLLLCAFGSDIQAISIHTGSLVGTFRGHNGLVSCILCPNPFGAGSTDANGAAQRERGPAAEDVVISSSIDGAVVTWRLVSYSIKPGIWNLEVKTFWKKSLVHRKIMI